MEHFLTDMSNRVEHQKQNQPAIEKWPFGFVFGVQLGLRQTLALIKTDKKNLLQVEQLWDKWESFTAYSSHCSLFVKQMLLICPIIVLVATNFFAWF